MAILAATTSKTIFAAKKFLKTYARENLKDFAKSIDMPKNNQKKRLNLGIFLAVNSTWIDGLEWSGPIQNNGNGILTIFFKPDLTDKKPPMIFFNAAYEQVIALQRGDVVQGEGEKKGSISVGRHYVYKFANGNFKGTSMSKNVMFFALQELKFGVPDSLKKVFLSINSTQQQLLLRTKQEFQTKAKKTTSASLSKIKKIRKRI